jgi:hypothetical protein
MKNSISTIKAKITRLNIKAASSKLYDDLEIDIKDIISKVVTYLNDEQPIFCYYLDSNYWWLLTNLRLIIEKNSVICYHLYNDIEQVNVRDIFEAGISNQECARLQILLKNGNEVDLDVEINTWFSVFNLLKFLQHK